MKYHPQQIHQMAVQFIMAEAFGDSRATELIECLSLYTNLPPDVCRNQIHQLATVNLEPMPA
jgi:hypothetical protein